jgi:hypothetical protein
MGKLEVGMVDEFLEKGDLANGGSGAGLQETTTMRI